VAGAGVDRRDHRGIADRAYRGQLRQREELDVDVGWDVRGVSLYSCQKRTLCTTSPSSCRRLDVAVKPQLARRLEVAVAPLPARRLEVAVAPLSTRRLEVVARVAAGSPPRCRPAGTTVPRSSLSAVCCLLSAVCCLLSAVCRRGGAMISSSVSSVGPIRSSMDPNWRRY
jgi:hypothetical protein